ncbi:MULTISPECIES: Tab2 family RNA-binding protein [Spirulina sp. CCY15215]|uniref:Tab2 family RNA-binding protein n=1 Tax=Spirulina sp. CCY15215 TaxID=2767591 RepID=UPI0019509E86|nr:Tab2 family RNA-binding protein [Spirulina major]
MTIWQVDLYQSSRLSTETQAIWELIICDRQGNLIHAANCPQQEVSINWILAQWQNLTPKMPDRLQVFRPQCANLLAEVAKQLEIPLETTRHAIAIKQLLRQRHESVSVIKPPPQPLPDRLWGERWRFANLPAGESVRKFRDRPIPILDIPDDFDPVKLGLASSILLPGIIIEGGRRSMQLARWLQEVQPYSLDYIPTEVGLSGGIVLEAGLCDRWILQTFSDPEVSHAAQQYQQRLQQSQGLHFLLIQPDNFNANYTGYWLLMREER